MSKASKSPRYKVAAGESKGKFVIISLDTFMRVGPEYSSQVLAEHIAEQIALDEEKQEQARRKRH